MKQNEQGSIEAASLKQEAEWIDIQRAGRQVVRSGGAGVGGSVVSPVVPVDYINCIYANFPNVVHYNGNWPYDFYDETESINANAWSDDKRIIWHFSEPLEFSAMPSGSRMFQMMFPRVEYDSGVIINDTVLKLEIEIRNISVDFDPTELTWNNAPGTGEVNSFGDSVSRVDIGSSGNLDFRGDMKAPRAFLCSGEAGVDVYGQMILMRSNAAYMSVDIAMDYDKPAFAVVPYLHGRRGLVADA